MVINYTYTNYFSQALLSFLIIAVTLNPIVNFVNLTSDSFDKEFRIHHKEGEDISQQEKQIDSDDNGNTCNTLYATTMDQKGERELIERSNKPNINLFNINIEVPYPPPKNSTRCSLSNNNRI